MFSENLKTLRKQRGMSQEVLAQQLNVVRQTVSKWEKGLSVPDAEMLTRISDLFSVPVSELLGVNMKDENEVNEIAAQLAQLNEYLAAKSRKHKRILRGILIAICAIILINIILILAMTISW